MSGQARAPPCQLCFIGTSYQILALTDDRCSYVLSHRPAALQSVAVPLLAPKQLTHVDMGRALGKNEAGPTPRLAGYQRCFPATMITTNNEPRRVRA